MTKYKQEYVYSPLFVGVLLAMLCVGEFLRLNTDWDHFVIGAQIVTALAVAWWFFHLEKPNPLVALVGVLVTCLHFGIVINESSSMTPIWVLMLLWAAGTLALMALMMALTGPKGPKIRRRRRVQRRVPAS